MTEIITVHDLRKTGYCVAGARRWARVRGLDFADFLSNGIAVERLEQMGDALATKVVERMRART